MEAVAQYFRRTLGHERYRFLQLATGVWGATLVSSTYAFGLISHHIKDEFDLNQQQLTTISTLAGVFGTFTIPGGAAFDKWGPRIVDVVGACMAITGYIIYGLLFAKIIHFQMWIIIIAAILTTWPTGFFDIGTLMPNLFTFPNNRGTVVVLQKTFMGLGASFLAVINAAFFESSIQNYTFFMACLMFVFGMCAGTFANLPKYESQKEEGEQAGVPKIHDEVDAHVLHVRANPSRFLLGNVLLWVALIFLFTASLLNAELDLPKWLKLALGGVAILIMLSFLLMGFLPDSVLPHKDESLSESDEKSSLLQKDRDSKDVVQLTSPQECLHKRNHNSFFKNLLGIDLWLLWYCTLSVWGGNILVIYNAAQVYRAANNNHYSASVNSMYVGLIGIGSALGRIAAGYTEQWMVKRNICITTLFPLPPILTALAFILFLVLPGEAVAVPFVIGSFGFGVSWAVIVLAMRLMHAKDVGKNYNFLFTSPMVTAVAFNRPLFGYFYDKEGRSQGLYPNCSGSVCYRVTFLVFAGLNVLAIFAGWLAHRRWMGNYYNVLIGGDQYDSNSAREVSVSVENYNKQSNDTKDP